MPLKIDDILPYLKSDLPNEPLMTAEEAARFVEAHKNEAALAQDLTQALQTIDDGAAFSETELSSLLTQPGGKEFLDSISSSSFRPQSFRFFAPTSDYGFLESIQLEAKDNPNLQRVLARPDFSATLSMIKSLPVKTFSPKHLIESLALWPADVPFAIISDMVKSILPFHPNSLQLRLDKIIAVARYPEYRRDILSPDFTAWACELVPNLVFGTSSLPELCHIYGLGPSVRRKVLNQNFQLEALRLNNLLNWDTGRNTDLNNRKLKKQNSFSAPSTRAMLLLLEHPLESKWTELQSFLVTHQNEADDVELYMVFSLMENNSALKSTFEKIMADPTYGQSQAYAREPIMRSDAEGTSLERPDWTALNPIVKFKALMLREKLDNDPQLVEMIAKLVADDIKDKVTEYGGIFRLNFNEPQKGDFSLVPEPLLSDSIYDGAYITRDTCQLTSLFTFHLHALSPDNRMEAGPSGTYSLRGDMAAAMQAGRSPMVITSTGQSIQNGQTTQSFNIDLYGLNAQSEPGFVMDLGEYSAEVQDYVFPNHHDE